MNENKPWFTATQGLIASSFVVLIGGLVCVGVYAAATTGQHLRYAGVGLLTALAALAVGCLAGFLFGIPKIVSTGELRQTVNVLAINRAANQGGTAATTDAPATGGDVSRADLPDQQSATDKPTFAPSSNLAEVSDWLTKLLLGAGLVSLTKLGEPIGRLIDTVARGLESPTVSTLTGSATTFAGALLFGFTALGFLQGYVVTTLWYGRRLAR